jgi:hypothetical protein
MIPRLKDSPGPLRLKLSSRTAGKIVLENEKKKKPRASECRSHLLFTPRSAWCLNYAVHHSPMANVSMIATVRRPNKSVRHGRTVKRPSVTARALHRGHPARALHPAVRYY